MFDGILSDVQDLAQEMTAPYTQVWMVPNRFITRLYKSQASSWVVTLTHVLDINSKTNVQISVEALSLKCLHNFEEKYLSVIHILRCFELL